MARKLSMLRIGRVDLVDAGANPLADVALFKRATPAEPTKPAVKKGVRMPDAPKPDEFDVTKLDDDAQEAFKALTTERDDLLKGKTEFEAAVEKAGKGGVPPITPKGEPDEDDVMKSLPAEVRTRLEKAEKENATNAEKIAKMEHDNRRTDFIAKAKELEHVGGPDELGEVLHAISDAVPEATYKALERMLKSANAVAEEGKVFAELGGNGVSADLDTKIGEFAKIKKSADPTMSDAQARTAVLNEHPDLYAEYTKSQTKS